ncbi:Linker histone H1/H5, domain H15 [Dillenia turbinata]|uniref:Linker histone H1/H5, domain H15 n=1 Tax=Dillenia turbinata TaxID=194707 RepID=A0AAN8UWQ2_9MAGN
MSSGVEAETPAAAVEQPPTEAPAAEQPPAAAETKAVKEKKPKEKKEKKPRAPKTASHPPYFQMIKEALMALNEKSGSSPYAIGKYMEEKHKAVLPANFKKMLALQLKNSAAKGKLIKIRASYMLSESNAKVPQAKKERTVAKTKKEKKTETTAKKPTRPTRKVAAKKAKKTAPAKPKQPKSIKSPAAKKAKKATA